LIVASRSFQTGLLTSYDKNFRARSFTIKIEVVSSLLLFFCPKDTYYKTVLLGEGLANTNIYTWTLEMSCSNVPLVYCCSNVPLVYCKIIIIFLCKCSKVRVQLSNPFRLVSWRLHYILSDVGTHYFSRLTLDMDAPLAFYARHVLYWFFNLDSIDTWLGNIF
jgi:hypothetical protein